MHKFDEDRRGNQISAPEHAGQALQPRRPCSGWRRLATRSEWPRLIASLWIVLGCLTLPMAVARADAPAGSPAPEMQQQALRFWEAVAATPEARKALLARDFSPGLRERRGDDSLLETLAMLAEALGPEMSNLAPSTMLGTAQDGELHYALADGRRVALMLTMSDTQPPQIERFGVKPLPPEITVVAPEQLPELIHTRLRAEFDAGRFSGAVLVARGDDMIHAEAIGLADREQGRAHTLDTPINLGSINKMFTAIAIAQLQAAGKLDWQDTVGRHLPDFPNPTIRDQVTIHQLLTHTSGVGSYWNEVHDTRRPELDSQQEFLDTFVDQPLLFEPGKGLEYSNGGPVILGLIIEALSGSGYYDYVREHIYQPAGMVHADHFRRDDQRAGFATGYLKNAEGQWQDNFDTLSLRGSAAGGGYASANDLYAFSRALRDGRLLSRPQLETLWEARGRHGPMGYGYLFSVDNTAGPRWVGHNGGAAGISAEFLHYPDDDLVIIVLANQDNAAMAMREWLHATVEAALFKGR